MSKITCEICGTTYDDTAGSCPVCGWNAGRKLDATAGDADDILNMNLDDVLGTGSKASAGVAGRSAAASAAAGHRHEPEEDDEEDEDEEESGSNTFLVIILVLLILALLAVSAYIGWTKLIKPRMGSEDNKPGETISSQVVDNTDPTVDLPVQSETEVPTEVPTETEEVTEDPGVPCTNLSLVGAMDTLTFKGQYWRLMVNTEPQNTTDKVVFTSGNENVVTIDEYGRVTAVGEGETVIIITCGSKRIETPAVVSYPSSATEATEGGNAGTDSNANAGTNVATPNAGAVLKLKKTDVTIGKKGVYITLELENDISASDVKWNTSDSGVATVWNGNVTAIGRGTCVITAEYNGQKAQCVVRVSY